MPVVSFENVHKAYGGFWALRGVDLQVEEGEVFGFLGPNGAGKTTTLRCLLDLIRPQRGVIRVFGLDVRRHGAHVRAQVGYLPGDLRLDEGLTGREHLRLAEAVRGHRADPAFVDTLVERLQVDLEDRVGNLSSGNRQKVGLVLALAHRPQLLVLDEPTKGLDPLMQGEVLSLLREACAHGATVIFSSHVISEVEAVADRVAMIRQGRIVEVARPEDLIRRALRRVRIRFHRPVDTQALAHLRGVSLLDAGNGREVTLQVEGTMERLLHALVELPVVDLDTERPSLEEIFLAYYRQEV